MTPITFIFVAMLVLIALSIVVELVLPMKIKNALGVGICWGMMAITMTFLILSTLGLIWVGYTNVIAPFFA